MGPPPPDSIANDWQLQCDDIPQRGAQVLKSGLWADCTFLVGSEQPVSFPAHRLLLAMASPVFQAMFYGSMAAGNTPVRISDMEPEVFKNLLQYIYTDSVQTESFDNVCALYYGAKKYMLRCLARKCIKFIQHNLLAENVCQAYELATLFEKEKLVRACLKEICNNTSKVLKASSFEDINLNTMVTVFSQETLNIASELELFQAADRYARARTKGTLKRGSEMEHHGAKRRRLDIEGDEADSGQPQPHDTKTDADQIDATDDEDKIECRASMRKAIEHIRFLTLTAAQFAQAVCSSWLLDEAEAFAVLLRLAHPAAAEPLPAGFSDRTDARLLPAHLQPKVKKASSVAAAEVVIEYSVLNFKTRRRAVESAPWCTRGGVQWRLRIVPENIDSPDKAIGVYVKCTGQPSPAWACPAEVTARILHPQRSELHRAVTFQHEYTVAKDTHGVAGMMTWQEACDPARGYLKVNTLVVEAHIYAELPPRT